MLIHCAMDKQPQRIYNPSLARQTSCRWNSHRTMPSTSHGKQKQVDKATLSHYLT